MGSEEMNPQTGYQQGSLADVNAGIRAELQSKSPHNEEPSTTDEQPTQGEQ